MSDLYADIIIDISHESLDRTFQYRVPAELQDEIAAGDRVLVPFGRGNREPIAGFVLELSDRPKIDPVKIKDIIKITGDDKLVEQKLIELAYWMKSTYGSTMNHALKTVLPIKKNIKNAEAKSAVLNIPRELAEKQLEEYEKKHQVARFRLLNALMDGENVDLKILKNKLNILPATINALSEKGIIRIETKRIYRNTVGSSGGISVKELLPEQRDIVDDFTKEYDEGIRRTYLLHGITGSGKTEVYMEMISHVIEQGKSAIVLIPEIALTYQNVMRFLSRFGDRVSTLHSKLSDGEKYDQFEKARKHETDIMIGPRSALFTPFDNLGLIVIDEEHEHTYKSEQMPKYQAGEVAIKLAGMHGASVVLGSATPDVSSYYKALNNEYKLYTLAKRAKGALLPTVETVDLRKELEEGNRSIFSNLLKQKIGERLSKNEQVMLFLNRRGYAGFVSCRSCGEVVKCPHCDVSLTSHMNGKLVCHYCGYTRDEIKQCPKCGSKLVGGMRAGTQAVEEQIKKIFPQAFVLRMDRDTTKQKNDYDEILSAFANHEADILVGTQMIVKGHDFPFVTLVGILAADMSLNGSDYKAAERTYQLIVQAAGRAGRGQIPGEVIVQSYRCDHYAIKAAVKQDYKAFYEEEMAYRELLGYPPAGHMLAILAESKDEEKCRDYAGRLADMVRNGIIKGNVCIGPAQATIRKISDIHRYVIYVKNKDMNGLIAAKDAVETLMEADAVKNVNVTFDFDPVNGY